MWRSPEKVWDARDVSPPPRQPPHVPRGAWARRRVPATAASAGSPPSAVSTLPHLPRQL
ncbi:unnamed protein product, partial [Musa banksii]